MARKGMGRGTGKGYKNIIGKDPRVHKDSSKGIKQPQNIDMIDRFAEVNRPKIRKVSESDLRQFTGTQAYHRWSILFPRFSLTDGTQYLAEKTQSYWFMDIIGSYQHKPKLLREGFQVWKLKKIKEKEAIVIAEDGNNNKLVTQKIPYTDFFDKYEQDEIEVYFVDGIILLPSEY